MGTVYLIHFDRPYFHAQHYLGYTEDLAERVDRHRRGDGSPLIRAVVAALIGWHVVRQWHDVDRNFERRLHNWHKTADLCPRCNPKSWNKNGENHHDHQKHHPPRTSSA